MLTRKRSYRGIGSGVLEEDKSHSCLWEKDSGDVSKRRKHRTNFFLCNMSRERTNKDLSLFVMRSPKSV